MNFKDASKVSSVVEKMKTIENRRGQNRALINDLYNGVPPYTPEEEKANRIFVNINWKEGTNVLHAARGQYENAFLKPGNFFKVTIDNAPIDKQQEWSMIVTKELNKIMKGSASYLHTLRQKFAGVALHGVGAQMWEDDDKWLPFFVGIQDILIPTDTEITMEDLTYFAVRRKMKPGKLYLKTLAKGKDVDPGWNLPFVKKILDDNKGNDTQSNSLSWTQNPEQMAELFKQNSTYYDSDSVPTIWMWDFYFKESGETGGLKPGWYRRIILDKDCNAGRGNESNPADPIQFVYNSKVPVADELGKFIHFQFGDGNNVPPFMYHSIRSLGWLLYDVIQLMNRFRCQFTQHVFEQMLTLFRVQDPTDRARLQKILLFDKGIIPEGASIVPAAERYGVDQGLVNQLQSGMKQLIQESSSSYTQQLDTGTQKERTKFEVEAIMSQISFLMSSMLNLAYFQEYFSYVEICRRFTKNPSHDFSVKRFRSRCIEQGVDAKCLNSDRWTIQLEQVLGAGNKMLELAQARELRGMRPTLGPSAQQEVDRMYIGALTDNARLADSLVPAAPTVSDSSHDAELSFGTLMRGVMVTPKEGVNPHDQVVTLLRLMGGVIKQINDTGGLGKPEDVIGLNTVGQYISQQIQLIAQDENEKQRVKDYNDMLSNFMNFVRAFSQRQQEAMKKQQQQGDPELQAKIQSTVMLEMTKMRIQEMESQQKMQIEQQEFEADQQRKNAESVADMNRKNEMAKADVALKGMQAGAAAAAASNGAEAASSE